MPQVSDRAGPLALPPLLLLGAAVGLVARLAFAFTDDGLLWPDEYYQSLEPAHRAVFGYGWQAWEFLEGARHWTLPGFVAGVMQLASAAGWDHLAAVEVTFCLVGALTSLAVYALARAQGATKTSATVVSTVFSLMGLAVYVAPRAMGETLSALPVALALAFLLQPPLPSGGEGRGEGSPRTAIAAGALLSLAVGLRLQNGLFCVFALALLLHAKRRREALVLLGTLVGGALVYGAVDWLTWGAPFHSALQYLRFNLVEGRSSMFGTHHPLLYLRALATAEGLTIIPLVGLSAYGWKTRRELPLIAFGFVLVHSLIPHKELRFIFPVIPLLAAHAALGLDRLGQATALSPTLSPRGARACWVLLACAVASLALLPTLTFGRLGITNPDRALSAIDYGGPENRLLKKAGQLGDLCGLKITSLEHWRTGGFAYLHKRVPMYGPTPGDGHYNYLIARRGSAAGTEVAVDGDVALINLHTPCEPDPAYDWHLE